MVQGNTTENGAQSDIMLKKALIERKLEETGEKARLEEYLRQRLIESGWRDDLKRHCLGKLSPYLFSKKANIISNPFCFTRDHQSKGTRKNQFGRLGGRTFASRTVPRTYFGQGGPTWPNKIIPRK